MATNERLRSALVRSGRSYKDLAEAVGVDAKTVERWVSIGRTPYRTTAHRAAAILREDVAYLWPSIEYGRRKRGMNAELIEVYNTRADAPFGIWRVLFENAEHEIGVLVYAAVFLHEQWPDFNVTGHLPDARCPI